MSTTLLELKYFNRTSLVYWQNIYHCSLIFRWLSELTQIVSIVFGVSILIIIELIPSHQ